MRHVRQNRGAVRLGVVTRAAEAQRPDADARALGDDAFEPLEGATDDEHDVRCVDLNEVLMRVLATPLRGHAGDGSLDDLQQCLLDALTGYVACDGRVVALARDLVDLVDVDDASLGLLDVEVGRLNEVQEDVLDILSHVAGLRQRGRVGDGEGHVQHAGERAAEGRLAGACRTDEQDVRLLEVDIRLRGRVDALVVVVDGDGEDALGALLADDVLTELLDELLRSPHGRVTATARRSTLRLLADDLLTQLDALVADVDSTGPRDQPLDLVLVLAAERTVVLHPAATCCGVRHRSGALRSICARRC